MVKNLPANAGDLIRDSGSVPGSGRSLEEANGDPLQYSCLENLMDRAAWRATVHGIAESQTQLSTHTHLRRETFKCIMAGQGTTKTRKVPSSAVHTD